MSYRENFDKSGYNADVDASANEIVWGSGSFTKMASAGAYQCTVDYYVKVVSF